MQQRSLPVLIIQIFFALLGLVLNSLITVPTYSLVTHMGSHQGKMNLLSMHKVTTKLAEDGGTLHGAMQTMSSAQRAMIARMQADGTFSAGHTENLTSAIGRMAEKADSLAAAHEKTMKLIDMAAEMTSVDGIEKLFGVVCHDAKELCHAHRATLFLVDEDTDEVWSIVAEGIPPIRFNKSIGIIGATVTGNGDGNPALLNIPDAYADSRFNRGMDQKTGYKTNNILCVPIRHNVTKKCIGAMQILNKTIASQPVPGPAWQGLPASEGGESELVEFDSDDIKIMLSFCKVVSNSIVMLQTERRKSIAAGGVDKYATPESSPRAPPVPAGTAGGATKASGPVPAAKQQEAPMTKKPSKSAKVAPDPASLPPSDEAKN